MEAADADRPDIDRKREPRRQIGVDMQRPGAERLGALLDASGAGTELHRRVEVALRLRPGVDEARVDHRRYAPGRGAPADDDGE